MRSWAVDDVVSFLETKDLCGPAATIAHNGFDGADLLEANREQLVHDCRFTPFAATKILAARQAYLSGHP
eukprot:4943779-Karenia_brevis.AAC.1